MRGAVVRGEVRGAVVEVVPGIRLGGMSGEQSGGRNGESKNQESAFGPDPGGSLVCGVEVLQPQIAVACYYHDAWATGGLRIPQPDSATKLQQINKIAILTHP
jgi:hypothetical protein